MKSKSVQRREARPPQREVTKFILTIFTPTPYAENVEQVIYTLAAALPPSSRRLTRSDYLDEGTGVWIRQRRRTLGLPPREATPKEMEAVVNEIARAKRR